MPRTRLELAHRNRHQPLKLACLPISPSGRNQETRQKIKEPRRSKAKNCFSCFFCLLSFVFIRAQNRTRTCTSLLTLVPETSASTNFAIWANFKAQGEGGGAQGLKSKLLCALSTKLCAIKISEYLFLKNLLLKFQ